MNTIKQIFYTLKEKLYTKQAFLIILVTFLIVFGSFFIWITTFSLPDINNFNDRRVVQSTKIYDRTGEIVLYDVFGDIKRTVVPLDEISDNLIKATIAIEDKNFYTHRGIQILAVFRAAFKNIRDGSLLGGQGGSTITQQVIKNALLTREKTLSRKIKEWVLAPRLEKKLSKDEILEVYLNEIPYGGTVYGAEEAARRFFGKIAKDLTLAESAYLAALPQSPTRLSPYGQNTEALENRKNLVLKEMMRSGVITKDEGERAMAEKVEFQKQEDFGIRAPHFVMYVLEQLEEEYGRDVIIESGLKVITTIDWELQEKAEEVVKKHALQNATTFNAENGAMVAVDPKTGEILVMVGSRDYFDEDIDGNFNVTLAERQPGSSFKPIIYAEAFNKGYRPETVVFDLQTEFSTTCADDGGSCYSPVNYDNIFRGPMSLRDALAQSVNVPAVKTFYLAGTRDALNLAKNMGLETLGNVDQYGLTLVLGGGEVRPLDLTRVYSVFANEGVKNPNVSVLKIEDSEGKVLFEDDPEKRIKERVLPEQTARLISNVLSDNNARTPAFGSNSLLNFLNNDVAVKTGTTNDYRDAWIVGYTPNISVAAWAGNNDNTSMEKKVAGFIVAPMWNEFMNFAISKRDVEFFNTPAPIDPNIKPILAGYWGGESVQVIDSTTGLPANENTLPENRQTVTSGGGAVHSILHWVNRANPLGPPPSNPGNDSQYYLWERSVRNWANQQGLSGGGGDGSGDSLPQNQIGVVISNPESGGSYLKKSHLVIVTNFSDNRPIISGSVFMNNTLLGSINVSTRSYSFIPEEAGIQEGNYSLKVELIDSEGKTYQKQILIKII